MDFEQLTLLVLTAIVVTLGGLVWWRRRQRRALAPRREPLELPPPSGARPPHDDGRPEPGAPPTLAPPGTTGAVDYADDHAATREGRGGKRPAAPLVLVDRAEPRHPVVFAHGFLGSDRLGPPVFRQAYFRGVAEALGRAGYDARFIRVSPTASIERRAAQLAVQIDRLGTPVNIIAHSMGGLDARYAISLLGLDQRVVSLTTVGTPHLGTPLADAVVTRIGPWSRTRRALDMAGLNVDGLFDLTTERMQRFNALVVDAPAVSYRSCVGRVTTGPADVHALLAPAYTYLRRAAGHNDGIVPASSQRWGEVGTEVDADHWAQIGWSGNFDAGSFYRSVVEELVRARL